MKKKDESIVQTLSDYSKIWKTTSTISSKVSKLKVSETAGVVEWELQQEIGKGEGKSGTAGRKAEEEDELINRHHMVEKEQSGGTIHKNTQRQQQSQSQHVIPPCYLSM